VEAAAEGSSGVIQILVGMGMDEADFANGSSDVVAFQRSTYPAHLQVAIRALPSLHGKMLVGDRQRIILGSANLTNGGLFENQGDRTCQF